MWALDGVDWRAWSAADRAAVVFVLLQRQNRDNLPGLRALFELVGDRESMAAIDRQIMGQSSSIVTDR